MRIDQPFISRAIVCLLGIFWATNLIMAQQSGERRSITGVWHGTYEDLFGKSHPEISTLEADGTFTAIARDKNGKVINTTKGRYTYADGVLTLIIGNASIKGTVTWISDDKIEVKADGEVHQYVRQKTKNEAGGEKTAMNNQNPRPERGLPPGFVVLKPSKGNGAVLIGRFPQGEQSATKLLANSVKALAAHFDGTPAVTAAIVRRDDSAVQGTIAGKKLGRPVVGFALAGVAERYGFVGVVYSDQAEEYRELVDLLLENMSGLNEPLTLRQTNYGSGTIDLPPGWQTTSQDLGSVSLVGPQGKVDRGVAFQVHTPRGAAGLGLRPPFVADYGDPVKTVEQMVPQVGDLLRQVGGGVGPRYRWIKLIDKWPSQYPNGKAAFVHFEWEHTEAGRTELWQTMAHIITAPVAADSFLFYYSAVSAPSKSFSKNLAALTDIANSWKPDPRAQAQRIKLAAESQTKAFQYIQEATVRQATAASKAHQAWSEYIREELTISNSQTGESKVVPASRINDIINQQNGGYSQGPWQKMVPTKPD